jgi:HPt (histidine-containing phosphotransfer) domain-containing protein
MNKEFPEMARQSIATRASMTQNAVSLFADTAAFDATGFDELSEMIGDDGVREMVMIFEAETRQRLQRLASGGQDIATQHREMHTLKGAAGSVAAPRLTALVRSFEQAAHRGIAPAPDAIKELDAALEAWLAALRSRDGQRRTADPGPPAT